MKKALLKLIRKFAYNYIIIIIIALWILSGAFGIITRFFKLDLLTVSESYIDIIFASQVSVSVLLSTVLTIITSSLTYTHLGFTIKEVLNFKTQKISHRAYICLSFISILVTSIWYAFDLIDSVSCMLIITILYIVVYSYQVISTVLDYSAFNSRIALEISDAIDKNDSIRVRLYVNKIIEYLVDLSGKKTFDSNDRIAWSFLKEMFIYIRRG